jgi:hypothetical protein
LNAIAELNDLADRSLLIVEDDKPFLERLSRAMETRGFAVTSCAPCPTGWRRSTRPRGVRRGGSAARRRQRARRGVGAEAQRPDARTTL